MEINLYFVKLPRSNLLEIKTPLVGCKKKMNRVRGVNVKATFFFVIIYVFFYDMVLVEKYKFLIYE